MRPTENDPHALVAHITEALVVTYKHRHGVLRAINDGLCVPFAEDLVFHLKQQTALHGHTIDTLSEDELKDEEDAWCEERMQDYGAVLPGDITPDDLIVYGDTGYHMWTHVDERHYDAECTDGVTNPFELPFYQRIFDIIRTSRNEITGADAR